MPTISYIRFSVHIDSMNYVCKDRWKSNFATTTLSGSARISPPLYSASGTAKFDYQKLVHVNGRVNPDHQGGVKLDHLL
jgi:hypothetical protein